MTNNKAKHTDDLSVIELTIGLTKITEIVKEHREAAVAGNNKTGEKKKKNNNYTYINNDAFDLYAHIYRTKRRENQQSVIFCVRPRVCALFSYGHLLLLSVILLCVIWILCIL